MSKQTKIRFYSNQVFYWSRFLFIAFLILLLVEARPVESLSANGENNDIRTTARRVGETESRDQTNRNFVFLVAASFALTGQAPAVAREIRPQKFSLYDSVGNSRGKFFVSPEAQVILVLADKMGEPRMTLTVAGDGTPAIGLMDKGDKIRAELSVSKDAPRLALYSKEQRQRILMNVGSDGSPRVGLMDNNQSPRIVMGGNNEDWGVATFDVKGKLLAVFGDKSESQSSSRLSPAGI